MALEVADRSSNKIENIEHAVEVLGRSRVRRAVFEAVYRGRSPLKSATEIADGTPYSRQQVVNEGKRLVDSGLLKQAKKDGDLAYEKERFYQTHRDTVLRYVDKPSELKAKPTKRRPVGGVTVKVVIPKKGVRARHITVDEIDSFSRGKKVVYKGPWLTLSEKSFKEGFASVLGEGGEFKDWGGESCDLTSTRMKVLGKRRTCAVAFKGPGTKGKLTPGKMGKNGDQVQRLALCNAEVFLVQYCGQIDASVLQQLEMLVQLKAYLLQAELWYGTIDGQDSSRLAKAYGKEFGLAGQRG
jgi:hypothetical protein